MLCNEWILEDLKNKLSPCIPGFGEAGAVVAAVEGVVRLVTGGSFESISTTTADGEFFLFLLIFIFSDDERWDVEVWSDPVPRSSEVKNGWSLWGWYTTSSPSSVSNELAVTLRSTIFGLRLNNPPTLSSPPGVGVVLGKEEACILLLVASSSKTAWWQLL